MDIFDSNILLINEMSYGCFFFFTGLPPQLFDSLLASVTKNFQITINNVHIRYEEKILRNFLCACGICIQSISITTTNK